MNYWFLLASVISLATCLIHCVAGGRFIVRPLMEAELAVEAKYTACYCWHLVTIVLAGIVLAFARAGIFSGGREVAAASVLIASLAALWSFAMVSRWRLPWYKFPQGYLFVLVALPGGLGLWLR
jgi:hypothetical protein